MIEELYHVLNQSGNPAHDDYRPVFSNIEDACSWLDLMEEYTDVIGYFIVKALPDAEKEQLRHACEYALDVMQEEKAQADNPEEYDIFDSAIELCKEAIK